MAEVAGRWLAEAIRAERVSLLIADLSGRAVVRLAHGGVGERRKGAETAERVPLDGTPQGHALEGQELRACSGDDGTWVYAPISNRGEAIGVLELLLPLPPDEATCSFVAEVAHVLSYVIIANRRFTDLFEWGQRSVPLSLAAEIQHCLLPGSLTCEAGPFTLAGWLEPAGEIAGDTFDFAIGREELHLSITDAMGHAVGAAILASVLVGALRNSRRAGESLLEQATRANDSMLAQARWGEFVTGQLVRIDLEHATARIVNAGHPVPIRLREGRAEPIELDAQPPFGTLASTVYVEQELPLEPGDRLLFVTDGMLERNAAQLDLRAELNRTSELHPREAVQQLAQRVRLAVEGALEDDATLMCFDWHGDPQLDR